jgi:uncharacterized protein YbjT (DUF2867 family)
MILVTTAGKIGAEASRLLAQRGVPVRVLVRNGKAIAPTGKAFDVEFGQTTKWEGDRLIIISAFWDAALQAKQIGLAG